MNKLWYYFAGIVTFLFGLVWVLGNLYFNVLNYLLNRGFRSGFAQVFGEVIIGGILGSFAIAIIFILPAIFYFKLANKDKQNKLLNWSTSLTVVAGFIMLIFIFFLLFNYFLYGLPDGIAVGITFLFFSIPTGIIYSVALLLLVINWFRNK